MFHSDVKSAKGIPNQCPVLAAENLQSSHFGHPSADLSKHTE
jgi:hypothetical protein